MSANLHLGTFVSMLYKRQGDICRCVIENKQTNKRQHNKNLIEIMASASSTSARSLFADSKMRLADRVQVNVNNISSLARQITRGSKSSEVNKKKIQQESCGTTTLQSFQILMHSARNFAAQEQAMDNTENNLKKMQLLCVHLGYQQDSMIKSAMQLEEVKEQVCAMQR